MRETPIGHISFRLRLYAEGGQSLAGGDAPHGCGHTWLKAIGDLVERKCTPLDNTPETLLWSSVKQLPLFVV